LSRQREGVLWRERDQSASDWERSRGFFGPSAAAVVIANRCLHASQTLAANFIYETTVPTIARVAHLSCQSKKNAQMFSK
jgi:hypothetical protein